jgi:hypothetical protein
VEAKLHTGMDKNAQHRQEKEPKSRAKMDVKHRAPMQRDAPRRENEGGKNGKDSWKLNFRPRYRKDAKRLHLSRPV